MSTTSVALPSSRNASLPGRLLARLRGRVALGAAFITLVVGAAGLIATHKSTPLVAPKAAALHAALVDRSVARMLASLHWERVDVTAMDSHYEILGFYRGPRIVAFLTVGWDGHAVILNSTDLAREKYQYGSNVANDARVLIGLTVVFLLMTAVWPLWRVRNVDVLVTASLVLSVVFYNRGMLTRMAVVSYPALAYLAIRSAWWALAPRPKTRAYVSLYDHLTRRWERRQRTRTLWILGGAAALVVAMTGLTSPNVLDVGYAAMEGATQIIHGVLPYGHIPDVLHGDTYPIGSYLLFVPFAWLSPVHNVWDNADWTLVVAVLAALLTAGGLWRLGSSLRHITPQSASIEGAGDRRSSEHGAGLRSAIAWLTFPPLLVTISTGTTDVALAAMLLVAWLLWRRPGWGMAALSAAAWFKFSPVAVLPLLLARLRGRALVRASLAIVVTSSVMVAALIAVGGAGAPKAMLQAMSFQFTRGSQHTLWTVIGGGALQQLAQAATVALIVGAVVRIWRDRALGGDPARIAAICAAVLLGLQICGNYWNYMYLVWAVPFLLLSLLREPVGIGSGGRTSPASGRDPVTAV